MQSAKCKIFAPLRLREIFCELLYFTFYTLRLTFDFALFKGVTMKKLSLLIASFLALAPLSAEIRDVKLGFEGCSDKGTQDSIRALLMEQDGVRSVRTVKARADYIVAVSWDSDITFSSSALFRAFADSEYPTPSIYITIDGDLINDDKSLLLQSKPDNSIFMIDYEQEDRIREESQDLTRFQRLHVEAKILNVREDNFLHVIQCTPY